MEIGGRHARWKVLLSEFDYIIETRPGSQHTNADALSRVPGVSNVEGGMEVRYGGIADLNSGEDPYQKVGSRYDDPPQSSQSGGAFRTNENMINEGVGSKDGAKTKLELDANDDDLAFRAVALEGKCYKSAWYADIYLLLKAGPSPRESSASDKAKI